MRPKSTSRLPALLEDLKRRGLLEDTLVLWGGEFGRTPVSQGDRDGRDHNPHGFTMWMAGVEQCAQDALLVAEKLGLESFYIGGHSLGGMISLEVGRRAPDKLRGVISLEGWTSWHAARDAFHSDMKATLTDEQLAELAAYRREVGQVE